MEGWFKIASVVVTATAAAVVAIAAFYESQRQENERRQMVHVQHGGNATRERISNTGFRVTNDQGLSSEDSIAERRRLLREAEAKRKLAKLKEERRKQLEEQEKKRKKEEDERKRKREEEEKERKKNEKMKSMLDSFDDVFDNEMGVKTDRVHVDENIDDWSRNAEKQKLKQKFRAKQMAQQQKIQDEKDQINSNNRTDDLKIEQQKSTITKCVIDKKFKIKEFILNAIINVNIENKFTLALSLKSIKKNKKKKAIDLQELESAVFSLQEMSQENEPSKTGAIPKSSKKKVKKKKRAKQTDTQTKQENKLETTKNNSENSKKMFVHTNLQDYQRKLELEKKKREEVIAEWKHRRKLRQQYHKLEPTKSFRDLSNVAPLQKQLVEYQKRKVDLVINKRREAERMDFKPNFYDNQIVHEMQDPYLIRLNQLSELMLQTKNNFAQYQEVKDEKEKINKHGEINQLKIVTQECANSNTTNKDTVATSLRGIEKNKRKKIIDLQELESAVNDLQEISHGNDLLQDHALPENVKEKVKKPKTKEQIAAGKLRKQLRQQKGIWKQKIKMAVCE